MEKKLSDLTVTELKSLLFDIDQQVKVNQNEYGQVLNYLKQRLENENPILTDKKPEVKGKVN